MSTVNLNPTCPLFMVPPIGTMLIGSLNADYASINAKYPTVNPDFVKGLNDKHLTVSGLINPKLILGQRATITKNIHDPLNTLPDKLRITEGHIT